MVHVVVSKGATRLFAGIGDGDVQLRIVAIVVGCVTKLTEDASGSVPVFTDQRSTPQFGVGVDEGVGLGEGLAPQDVGGEELLRGFGAAVTKSVLLLSVSVQPPLILSSAVVLLGAFVAVAPSKQLAPP